ncbi:MAG: tetratricopeptide (TPR) repeat protein [Hyphomicrobiaceae bacterium]|jgi:tetratricopeptide (TPR) repeat protein
MATKEKFDRKQLRSPDAVQEQLGAVTTYIQEHRSVVLAGVGALMGLAVLISAGISYVAHSRDVTASAFARAVSNIQYDSPSAAVVGLTNLADRDEGTYSELAVLYRARVHSEQGEYALALSDYESAIDNAPTDYLRQAAMVGRAFALVQLDKTDEALTAYAEASEIDGPYRVEALQARSRVAERLGNTAVAIESLRKLLEQDLGDDRRQAVDDRLQALEAS